MNYRDSVDYVNSFINFEKIPKYQYTSSFRLERMEAILEGLANPHKGLNAIHIAGSKGKGSTCAITAYILKEAGYKVGLYTSPHLLDFKERIRILYRGAFPDAVSECSIQTPRLERGFEGMISEEEFVELVEEIEPVAEKFREHKSLGKASFFEIVTACAFLYFKKQKVDAVVLETGLGGRLDATNVVMSLACGITNISFEHTDKLGETLEKIAYEKAGIIKAYLSDSVSRRTATHGVGQVVSASQAKKVRDVIGKVCEERNARLYEVGKDIKYSIVSSDENSQVFDLEGPGYSYKNLELNLIGAHQVENAAISIGIIKSIDDKFKIKESDIRKGLESVIWPGRLQVINRLPYIILDGAHNSASIFALISSIKKLFKYRKLISVFGISSDKDVKGISSILGPVSDIVILTKAKDNPRAQEISELRYSFQGQRQGIEESNNIDEALQKALKLADKEDLILITGSLFVVGDAIRTIKVPNFTNGAMHEL